MFKVDSRFWVMMDRLGDLLLLSLLWFLASLPLLTIPAALAALFQVTQQRLDRPDISLVKVFFTSFLQAFKHSTLRGWFLILACAGGVMSLLLLADQRQSGFQFAGILLILSLGLVVLLLLYCLPLVHSPQSCPIPSRVKWGFYLACRHLPWSVLLLGLFLGTLWLTSNFLPLLFLTAAAFVTADCWIVNKLSRFSALDLGLKKPTIQ